MQPVRSAWMGRRAHGCLLAALAVVLVIGDPAAAAPPDLRVTAVGKPPASVVPGDPFRLSDTVANRGAGRAGQSDTRFYLTVSVRRSLRERRASDTNPRSALSDLLLTGARRVPALAPGTASPARRRRAARVEVPAGTPPGEYRVLACADDRGRIREAREHDNCRAAKRKLRVSAPNSGLTLRSEAFADVFPEPAPAADEAQLPVIGQSACRPEQPKRYPGVGRAVEEIKRVLAARAGPEAYRGFRRSAHHRSALAAERAAAAAAFFGQPGAALAAFVRAHELQPGDASHLVNAAALATGLAMPNEALALLDEAARLDDTDHPAMGVSRQAVALSNRAHALASVGRYPEALRVAETASAIEPLLKEAHTTAGVASLCAGRPAITMIRRGRKRHPDKDPPLDESGGRESRLRALALPGSPAQAVSLAPFHEAYSLRGSPAEQQERIAEEKAVARRIAERNSPSRAINAKLHSAVHAAGNTPRLIELHRQATALGKKVTEVHTSTWCSGTSCSGRYGDLHRACLKGGGNYSECMRASCVPAAKGWHQSWLAAESAYYDKLDEYFRAYSQRASAIAAHIKDPDAHRRAMLAIETSEQIFFRAAQDHAYYWTTAFRRYKEDCVEGSDAPPSTAGTEPSPAKNAGACPRFVEGIRAVIDFGVANVKVDCSEIELGGSLGAGWIKGFGKVGYDFRTGRVTVFAGSQGAIRGGPLSAEFRSGIYLTASSQGIEDVGWRVGPGVKVDGGFSEFKLSDSVDISFVSAFATPGT